MVLLKLMLFRLNLFLWLHLIPRKFHFQFQSNPDDKYQPAPFHRKWKIPVSILFFCFGGYRELGNGMFCQNANDFWCWVKKDKVWYFSGEDLEGKLCPLGVSLGNVESFTKWISNWPTLLSVITSSCKFRLFNQSLGLKGARQILFCKWTSKCSRLIVWERWGWKEPNLQNPLLAAPCHFLASCKTVIARILVFRQRQVQHQSWWQNWPILCALPLCF